MNIPCPKCNAQDFKKVIHHYDGTDNINNLSHYHLECLRCGKQFNHWDCSKRRLKEIFDEDYHMYK